MLFCIGMCAFGGTKERMIWFVFNSHPNPHAEVELSFSEVVESGTCGGG